MPALGQSIHPGPESGSHSLGRGNLPSASHSCTKVPGGHLVRFGLDAVLGQVADVFESLQYPLSGETIEGHTTTTSNCRREASAKRRRTHRAPRSCATGRTFMLQPSGPTHLHACFQGLGAALQNPVGWTASFPSCDTWLPFIDAIGTFLRQPRAEEDLAFKLPWLE